MNDLVTSGQASFLVRRSTARALDNVRSEAIVKAARVAAIGHVASAAMQEAAFLAQKHVQIVAVIQCADQGCALIREAAVLGMAQVVTDMGRWS